jgi:N-carbamoyl-L-amino-acid hydrolase
MDLEQSVKYLNYIMDRFYPIGEDSNGGVTRLAYTALEDQMHEEFISIGKEEGYQISVDQVGNSYLSLGDYDEYYLVGSHLDSVVNGGRYDGVLGVAVGLLLLKVFKEEKIDIPLKVVALRCEESSNFMKATFGSSLITGEVNPKDFELLKSRTGENQKSRKNKRS